MNGGDRRNKMEVLDGGKWLHVRQCRCWKLLLKKDLRKNFLIEDRRLNFQAKNLKMSLLENNSTKIRSDLPSTISSSSRLKFSKYFPSFSFPANHDTDDILNENPNVKVK